MKMRERVSNKMSANKTAEVDKKYLFKRITEPSYSFVQT